MEKDNRPPVPRELCQQDILPQAPKGFRIHPQDIATSPFTAGDIIHINAESVRRRRQLKRITRDGR